MNATPPSCTVHRNSRKGFTLIELLIVITIIAILAGMAFPAYNSVIRGAQKAKANAAAQALVSAIEGYHLEYGRYPGPAGADVAFDTSEDADDLLICLLGEHQPNGNTDFPNSREIPFLDPTYTDVPKGGMILDITDAAGTADLYDPWGGGYLVVIDLDYDDKLDDPDESDNELRKSVLVGSAGVDQSTDWEDLPSPGDREAPKSERDNVRTWK